MTVASSKYTSVYTLLPTIYNYMGGSINGGTPKWMVYFLENPIQMDDLGYAYFRKPPTIVMSILANSRQAVILAIIS